MNESVFDDLVKAIYGDALSPEVVKTAISKGGGGMPKDASLKEARTGQALNAVATVGALNALRMAAPEFKHARSMPKNPGDPRPKPMSSGQKNKTLSPLGRQIKGAKLKVIRQAKNTPGIKAIARNPRKAAIAATGGMIGLHSTELVGDVIAARSLHRSAQRAKYNEAQKAKIKKSFDEIIEARRRGSITTEQALQLVEKGFGEIPKAFVKGFIKGARKKQLPQPKGPGVKQPTMSKLTASRNLIGAGAVAGGGGVYGYQKYKQAKQVPVEPAPVSKSSDMVWNGEISKVDSEKRQVFGWCSLTSINGEPVVDLQGDYVPLEEIEKAAYDYVLHSRKGGDMHARDGEGPKHTADLIESFLVTPEKLKQMGLDEHALPHGWWIGMKVNDDDQWNLVKNGGRTGFSIHGKGSRIEKML